MPVDFKQTVTLQELVGAFAKNGMSAPLLMRFFKMIGIKDGMPLEDIIGTLMLGMIMRDTRTSIFDVMIIDLRELKSDGPKQAEGDPTG